MIECPNCGVVYRSRQYWFGNQDPVDTVVRTEIVHVWPGVRPVHWLPSCLLPCSVFVSREVELAHSRKVSHEFQHVSGLERQICRAHPILSFLFLQTLDEIVILN